MFTSIFIWGSLCLILMSYIIQQIKLSLKQYHNCIILFTFKTKQNNRALSICCKFTKLTIFYIYQTEQSIIIHRLLNYNINFIIKELLFTQYSIMLSLIHKQGRLNRMLINVMFNVSKMANYASEPRHDPTVGIWEYGDGVTPSKLKVSIWNVNGLRSVINKGQLAKYLEQNDPDFLCINETKMDYAAFKKQQQNIAMSFQNHDSNAKFKKKTSKKSTKQQEKVTQPVQSKQCKKFGKWYYYFNFCKVSSGYSGVLTLSKYKPLKATQDFPLDHHLSLQGRSITLQYQKFFLVNCYKPNSGNQLQRLQQRTEIYDRSFSQYVKKLLGSKQTIVCGDMNVAHKQIDLARPKTNKKSAGFTIQERSAFDYFLKQTLLVDSYRHLHPNKVEYTWWSTRARARQTNIGWRIDYILVSNPQIIKQVQIQTDVMGSDHCPVQCLLQLQDQPKN